MKKALLFLNIIAGTIVFAQTPQLLKDINPSNSTPGSAPYFNVVNNTLVLVGNEPSTGYELWTSDGTTANTTLLKDINVGTSNGNTGSIPYSHFYLNGKYYIASHDGIGSINGSELWETDLTPTGTNLFYDLTPTTGTSYVFPKFVYNNKLYFTDGNNLLYHTDGTVTAVFTPSLYINGPWMIFNNLLYLSASTSTTSGTYALYVTDGTSSGTNLVKDINPGSGNSGVNFMTPVNTTQFVFTAWDGGSVVGEELWISDGTNANTTLLKDINTGTVSSSPGSYTLYNGKFYFTANGGTSIGQELYVTDGTANGTLLVKDIRVTGGSVNQNTTFYELNGLLYFVANDGSGRELWKTDGTAAGTTIVKDINPGSGFGIDNSIYQIGNKLYFGGNDGVHGRELWASDGTTNGTYMVYDLNPGVADGFDLSSYVKNIGNRVFFVGDNGVNGTEMYYIDDLTLKIAETENNEILFSVYPNPAQEIINIKLKAENNDPTAVKITNILGEIISSSEFENNKNISLNTTHLRNGIYFLTVTNQGKSNTQKIIIE